MREFYLGVVEMSNFNFLTRKSIFHLSEHRKYFSQPWWDIQVCLLRDESPMDSIEILGSLYMMSDMKIER